MEGVRTIFNLWIVAVHTMGMFTFAIYTGKPAMPEALEEINTSRWKSLAYGMNVQVDVFFMLSGFLLSWSCLKQDYFTSSLQADFIKMMLKRLFRLWPAILVAIAVTYLLGDMHSGDWRTMLRALLFPISAHQPIAFIVNWSARVDLQCSLVLFLTIAVMSRLKVLTLRGGLVAALLSITPKLVAFALDRHSVSYITIKRLCIAADDNIPVYMTVERQQYFCNFYPLATQHYCAFTQAITDFRKQVLQNDMFPFHQRLAPFFIGLVLALALQAAFKQAQPRISSMAQSMHSLYLIFAGFTAFAPAVVAVLSGGQKTIPLQPGEQPDIRADFFVTVLHRPLYSVAIAYLLYRCLLPVDHPLKLVRLSSVLSNPLLKSLGIFSFGIYTIHLKVLMEIAYRYLPMTTLHQLFGDAHAIKFLVWLGAVYGVSLGIAFCTHHLVEKPFGKYIAQPLLNKLKDFLGEKKKDKQG